jgi:hypothetical protein
MSAIQSTQRLTMIGDRARIKFLKEIELEAREPSTDAAVKQAYASMVEDTLGDSPYMFITINLDMTAMGRALNKRSISRGNATDEGPILGREYLEARRAGEGYRDAMETLLGRFLHRLNKEVLGTHRYVRCGQSLRCIWVYENPGKQHAGIPVNHVHVLLEIPPTSCYQRLEAQVRELFSWLIYPLRIASTENAVLDIRPGRLDGISPHPEYIQKQLVNWETAADRVCFSVSFKAPLRCDTSSTTEVNYDADRTKAYCC